jgi:hypothetical protein
MILDRTQHSLRIKEVIAYIFKVTRIFALLERVILCGTRLWQAKIFFCLVCVGLPEDL